METIKSMRQNKALRVFVRQTFNGFVTLLLAYLADLQGDYVVFLPLLYAMVNRTTKYINTTYFSDLGVEK
jgi:hypothetical protein